MGAFEAGGGVGGALGALSAMWREVYRKAAAVAEQRAVELLRDHVYQYQHGGGGGWVLLDELGPLPADTASPLAFTGVPQDCRHLWLHVSGRTTGTGLGLLGVQVNGDSSIAHYSWSAHYVQPTAVHSTTYATADNGFVFANTVNASEAAGALCTADVYLWGYAKTDSRYKSLQATAQSDDLDALLDDKPEHRQTVGVWRSGSPITAVRVFGSSGAATFAAGTHVELFGLRA